MAEFTTHILWMDGWMDGCRWMFYDHTPGSVLAKGWTTTGSSSLFSCGARPAPGWFFHMHEVGREPASRRHPDRDHALRFSPSPNKGTSIASLLWKCAMSAFTVAKGDCGRLLVSSGCLLENLEGPRNYVPNRLHLFPCA